MTVSLKLFGSACCASSFSSLRYLMLAGPVMPGRSCKRRRLSPCNWSAYPGMSGRGPTKLICPINTLTSSVRQSTLLWRNQRPIRVTRGSPARVKALPSAWSYMVRNLQMRKGLPFLPMRHCLKKNGPLESNLMRTAMRSSGRKNKASPMSAKIRSKHHLKKNPILCLFFFTPHGLHVENCTNARQSYDFSDWVQHCDCHLHPSAIMYCNVAV